MPVIYCHTSPTLVADMVILMGRGDWFPILHIIEASPYFKPMLQSSVLFQYKPTRTCIQVNPVAIGKLRIYQLYVQLTFDGFATN